MPGTLPSVHRSRLAYVTIDCADLEASFQFWSQALGAINEPFGDSRDETYRRIAIPQSDLRIVLQKVPDTKNAKTPVHLCIESDDVEAETTRLVNAGATVVDRRGEFGLPLNVLADPFGNEFCVIQPGYPELLREKGAVY